MKKLLLFLLCLGTFAWGQPNADDANAPALTIYNQNFFVAREHLPLDLHSGVNRILRWRSCASGAGFGDPA